MKFGERLEEASVPGWSVHNVDYNSLKHQIKAHTTKDQATTAMAIPGQQDHTLKKFEDGFYLELCAQHDRLGLFVTSKADEVSRRLRTSSSLPVKYIDLVFFDARRSRSSLDAGTPFATEVH
jgi:SPX domain protein involved in polyphosphate accumulation